MRANTRSRKLEKKSATRSLRARNVVEKRRISEDCGSKNPSLCTTSQAVVCCVHEVRNKDPSRMRVHSHACSLS